MRRHASLMAAVLLGTVLTSSACDQDLAGINEDPNSPTDVGAQYVLPRAIQSSVEFGGNNTWFTLEFAGLFTQHWAKIQYTTEDQYGLRDGVVNAFWNGMYAGPMKDWQLIIEKGIETAEAGDVGMGNNHQAVGMIGKTYVASIMTDLWGDIPYSQALQADAEESITQPEYDAQQAVYTQMLADLETAVGLIDASAASFADADLMYGGDMDLWERFANSLRLRLAMRISDVDAATAQSIVETVSALPLIVDNAQNAGLEYTASAPQQNPLYENASGSLGGGGTRDDHSVSNTLVGIMAALNDPRLPVYAEPAAQQDTTMDESWCGAAGQLPCEITYNGDVYRGMRNGVDADAVPKLALISRIGSHFRAQPTTTQYIMTAAEVHFLLAEAAENGWAVGGTPAGHYEAGIAASFDMWDGADGVDLGAAVLATYMAEAGVAFDAANAAEQIAEQKWLALYSMPWEAYAESRRTGYPDEILPAEDATLGYVPGRIPYPSLENSLNEANLAAAIANQNTGGGYDGTLWWDMTPP